MPDTDNKGWSSNIGTWFDIPLRYHYLLIVFCALIFALEINATQAGYTVFLGTSLATVSVLLLSIVLHELAHCLAVRDVGGEVRQVVLMPWGGNSEFALPRSSSKQTLVFSAGLVVNALVFGFGAFFLVMSGHAAFLELINPFRPIEFESSEFVLSVLKIATWVNFQLTLVNLIPCFPFDGARILRAIMTAAFPASPRIRLESAIQVLGHGFALAMIGLAICVRGSGLGVMNCGWIVLMLGGITLIYATRYSYQRQIAEIEDQSWEDDDPANLEPYYADRHFNFDDSNFNYSDDSEPSIYSNWLREKQDERRLDLSRTEEEEYQRVDAILEKLHNDGIASLNQDEREILDRVSARLRRRRQVRG